MLNRISCGGDGCQDRLVLPVDVVLDAPVETQHGHQDQDHDPEDPTKPWLVGKEDVDQALLNFMY